MHRISQSIKNPFPQIKFSYSSSKETEHIIDSLKSNFIWL